jgi:dihydropteroate synthase
MNDNTNSMGPRPHDFFWQTTRFNLSLTKPLIMGIVNVTPDSFSDQGRYASTSSAVAHAAQLLKEGADILDIGGESSRPGAQPIDAHEEWARLKDVLTEVIGWSVPISLDSYRLETQLRALELGVDIINDIWALRREGAAQALLSYNCGVCLMHMNGEPSTMQRLPMPLRSDQALEEVKAFLQQRTQALASMGYSAQRLVIDPGIGFGKTVEQNLHLLKNQASFAQLGSPILIGWSRKSTLGQVCDCDVSDRLIPSIAAMVLAADKGAHILRVHDVRESVQALKIWRAVHES